MKEEEKQRLLHISTYEQDIYNRGYQYVAGVDEAGRGPLAGPVVAAAVVLKKDNFIEGINDSKKISPKKREKLYEEITKKCVCYSVGIVDEKCIDRINILNATKIAMYKAIKKLSPEAEYVLIDAVRMDDLDTPYMPIVKGDTKSVSIAAASIIAKVTRDRMMREYHDKYPEYGFSKHKGYGTSEHISAIKKHGLCPIHRVSFTTNFIEV